MKNILLIFLILAALPYITNASDVGKDCTPDQQDNVGGLSFGRFFTMSNGCYLRVSPIAKPDLRYRDYTFDERGAFTIFISDGEGDDSKITGQRSYFFFPRLHVPSYKIVQDKVIVTLPSDTQIIFSTSNARLLSIEDGSLTESPEINLKNNGGVEIKSYNGIYLDTGWKIGKAPYKDSSRTSTFKDANGKTCTLPNEELFYYEQKSVEQMYDEPLFKFQKDDELAEFLKVKCSQLNTISLRPRDKT